MAGSSFKVHRGQVTQSAVEPFWVIERFDIVEDGQFSFGMGSEVAMVEPLGFERAPERFHSGVVVAVAGGAHAGKSSE